MTNETLKVALTKRALSTQLMRAGAPKQDAEQITARLTHGQRWKKLPQHVRSDIAWKAATTEITKR